MVRRAILDRGAQSDDCDPAVEAAPGVPGSADQRAERSAPHWRGAGGRWFVWVVRAVAWAVLLVIGYRGVTAIVLPPKQAAPATGSAAADSAHGFPVPLAEAYAQQFAVVYLNFSPATSAERARQLAVFLPPGSDSQLGWNGQGSSQLQSEQVAGIKVQDSQHAIVTLLVRANGNLMELGVPVYAADGGLAVSAEPSLAGPAAGRAAATAKRRPQTRPPRPRSAGSCRPSSAPTPAAIRSPSAGSWPPALRSAAWAAR